MKRKRDHFEREARMRAILLTATLVVGLVAGVAVPWLGKLLGWHPH